MSVRTLTANQILNNPANLGNTSLWVSPTINVPRNTSSLNAAQGPQVRVQTVTVQKTGLTQAYALDAQGNLNYDRVIATRRGDSNVWVPTPFATSEYGRAFADSIANNGAAATPLESVTNSTVSSGLRAAGASYDQDSVSRVLSGQGVQGGGSSGNLPRPPGAGALPGRSGGEADVSGTRDQVAQSLTSLSSLALSITGEAASPRKAAAAGLKYPESFPDNMDYVKFSSKTYGNKNLNTTTFVPGERSSKNAQTEESVILPIQSAISDANTVGWNEETFNPAQIIGANLAISGITGGGSAFIGSLKEALDKSTQQNMQGSVEKAIIAYFTEQAIGTQVLSKVSGAVFNPNTELLFQGPQLRSFSFNFKLTPRSDTESKIVRQIIGFFKRNMAPQTETSGLYLKAPKIFNIDYYYNGTKGHPGIGLIKDCALQACNVDYTPDGSYMSFEDGAMVSYNLSLQFMELEPVYAKDYDDENAKDHLIGY